MMLAEEEAAEEATSFTSRMTLSTPPEGRDSSSNLYMLLSPEFLHQPFHEAELEVASKPGNPKLPTIPSKPAVQISLPLEGIRSGLHGSNNQHGAPVDLNHHGSHSNTHQLPAMNGEYHHTEGHYRRLKIVDFENECTEIMNNIFVGGAKVSSNWETLRKNGITRIVNCCFPTIDNSFAENPDVTYLTLNMLDGPENDIMWFICEVLQFIDTGLRTNQRTLLHCEKGVSRSCALMVAFRMWKTGECWKDALHFVKEQRAVAEPNISFLCNLVEFDDLINGDSSKIPILLEFAWFQREDHRKAVLKVCRIPETRKLVTPRMSVLQSSGVYVLRAPVAVAKAYVWRGANVSDETWQAALSLVQNMVGVLTHSEATIEYLEEGKETEEFKQFLFSGNMTNVRKEGCGGNDPLMPDTMRACSTHRSVAVHSDSSPPITSRGGSAVPAMKVSPRGACITDHPPPRLPPLAVDAVQHLPPVSARSASARGLGSGNDPLLSSARSSSRGNSNKDSSGMSPSRQCKGEISTGSSPSMFSVNATSDSPVASSPTRKFSIPKLSSSEGRIEGHEFVVQASATAQRSFSSPADSPHVVTADHSGHSPAKLSDNNSNISCNSNSNNSCTADGSSEDLTSRAETVSSSSVPAENLPTIRSEQSDVPEENQQSQ